MYSPTNIRFWMLLLLLLAACTPEVFESVDDGPIGQLTKSLADQGLAVAMGEELSQPFFAVPAQIILVENESVQLFLFEDESTAQAAAEQVSPDGFAIGPNMVSWIAPPHFYRDGALITIYPGSSEVITSALMRALGEQFAGEAASESTDDFPEPPAAYLTVDGVTQESGIGAYCWGTGAGPRVCADKIGIPTQLTALEVTPLALMKFELLVGQVPDNATVTVRSVTESDIIEASTDGWQWWLNDEPWNQFSLPPTEEPQIELTLPSGLNVLSLFVSWPDYGDVTYGFLVDVNAAGPGPGSGFWTLAEDPRTGIRFAAPCFWRVELPGVDPSGYGSFPVVNYSVTLRDSLVRGEGVFASGGLKIDFIYIRPSQLGLSARDPLAAIPAPLMGEDVVIEEMVPVEVNGQAGLLVSTYDTVFDAPGHSYLFALDDDLVLLLGIVPGAAIDHPDIQGIVHSLALSDGIAVQVPDVIPAGPPTGDGPYACMAMGGSELPHVSEDKLDCPAIAGSPEALACDIQAALLARDMVALEALMADPFVIAYWQSEGRSSSPTDVSTELSESRLPADTAHLTFTADRARFPDLDGLPVEALFGPNNNTALIIYSEGWGSDGQGAALLYLVYDFTGELRWTAILYAGQSFD